MNSLAQTILSTLSLLGLGGIIGAYVSFLLGRSKELEFKRLKQKEKRYKSCLLYMDVFFEPKNIKYLSSRQPDINNAKDVLEYLKAEYHEMLLYASRDVILAVKNFIERPTRNSFMETVLKMRQDLWVKKPDLDLKNVKLKGRAELDRK